MCRVAHGLHLGREVSLGGALVGAAQFRHRRHQVGEGREVGACRFVEVGRRPEHEKWRCAI
jgi:hypothetical protein